MRDRLKKVERIMSVQGKLHRLAEARLAALDREQAAIGADRTALVEALNRDDALQGIFVEAMAKRLKALAREADRLKHEQAAQSRRLSEAGLLLRRTERMTEKVRREYLKELGKRGFGDFLDTLAQTDDDASLP